MHHLVAVDAAQEAEERQNDEELDGVAPQHHKHVLADRTDDHAGGHLRGELRRERDDAHGKRPDEALDHSEEDLLESAQRLVKRLHVGAVLLENGNGDAEARRNQHHRQHVALEERIDEVVRQRVQDVSIDRLGRTRDLRHCTSVLGDRGDRILGDRARVDQQEESETDERRDERRQHRVGERAAKDLPHRIAFAQRRHRREDGKRHRRHRDELEEPRVGRRDEIHEFIDACGAERTKNTADDQRGGPDDELLEFHFYSLRVILYHNTPRSTRRGWHHPPSIRPGVIAEC